MTTLWADLETYSEINLKSASVHRYAEAVEVMILSFAWDDDPVEVLDLTAPNREWWREDFQRMLNQADEFYFHKSDFDRTVLRAQGVEVPLHKLRDTFVQAMAHSLPGGMEKLCAILKVPVDQAKDAEGRQLIQLFCKPRPKKSTIRRANAKTHPREWQQFLDYAGQDIHAMRAIRKRLPSWNYSGQWLDLWHLDQRINDRGIPLDLGMAAAAIRTADRVRAKLAVKTADLTGGEVGSTTQRDALLAHMLAVHGVELPDLKSDTIERRLDDPELPWQVKALLLNRMEASRAATAKYKAMLRGANSDGRVRGTLQFAGALRTARWSGRMVQPQNMMRTPEYLANEEVDFAAEAIAADAADLFYEKPLEVLAAGVPWTIKAPPGKKLVVSDLSNIEGRVLAWLAGEQWKLDAFREQDADPKNKAKDLYIIGYARSFAMAIAEVVADFEAGGKKRQVGKVQELALGYEGSVGAYVSMAAVYGIDLNTLVPALATVPKHFYDKAAKSWTWAEGEGRTFGLERPVYMVCHAFSRMWRAANPSIERLWGELQDAARGAILNPGQRFPVGRVEFQRLGEWLRVRLPSGWYLCYPNPKVNPETGKISYKGVNQYTRKWSTIHTYGGKLAENITQAIATGAGGLLGAAMPHAEEAGYEIVFDVHDELVAEVPDTDEYSADELGEILATNPSWADGLPLAVGGYETYRYRKD